MKRVFSSLAILAAIVAGGCSSEERAVVGAAGIDGNFSAIVHLSPHALDQVHIDLYEDFTCPACQRLESTGLPAIEREFGARIIVRRHYLAGPATAPAAKILYDIASDQGKGPTVANALFGSTLKHGDDAANLPAIRAIAKQYGLDRAFEKAYGDGSGKARIKAEWEAMNHKVAYFPFVVFENDIAANGDAGNISAILRSLLKTTNATR
jgi:predicted DsbA family dithiol-disulfide isomerase